MTRSIALDVAELQVLSAPGRTLQDDSLLEAVRCYYCGDDATTPFITAEDDLTGRRNQPRQRIRRVQVVFKS